MSKQYQYIRLENIEKYEGWDLVEVIPAKFERQYDMAVICNGEILKNDELQAENEELQLENSELQLKIDELRTINKATMQTIAGVREEVAKEFAKKIEDTTWYSINSGGELVEGANGESDVPLYKAEDILKIAEKMVGDNDESEN